MQIEQIVDLQRYPIDDLNTTAAQRVISHCKEQLQATGLCLLPNFIQSAVVDDIRLHAQSNVSDAHHTEHWRATPNGDEASPDQTLSQETRASMSCIGFDRMDEQSPLRKLYLWQGLTEFINTLTEGPKLFTTTDPLVSCMLTVLHEGDELGWHYDPNDLVVSFGIQQSDAGGEFEFVPRIRSPEPGAMAAEQAVLSGTHPDVIKSTLTPGTLSLFNGHRSLHRVTPVSGATPRIIGLFNYSEVPYYNFDSSIQRRFFGRVHQPTTNVTL